jgi:hypothetical protein
MRLENTHLTVGLLGPFFVSSNISLISENAPMLPFPADQINDEDVALEWWDNEFATCCESLGGLLDGAALVRSVVASIRNIRRASLGELLTVTQAATETGYSTRQIRRWLRDRKVPNLGTDTAPRVRRGDVMSHRKPALPRPAPIRIMETAQDIARSVANSKSRNSDG